MADNTENTAYDENQAIAFIRSYMPAEIRDRYNDDEILNIIDMIWDFYEDNGLLEIPADDNITPDQAESQLENVMAYVRKMLSRDKLAVVDTADVKYIVEGELAYEKSIGLE